MIWFKFGTIVHKVEKERKAVFPAKGLFADIQN